MVDKITIDEGHLKTWTKMFDDMDNDSANRLGAFNWWSPTGSVQANVAAALRMNPGASSFLPGADLYSATDAVRSNLADRLSQFNEQCSFLTSGLKSFLDNTKHVDDLNQTTASDFDQYVQEASGGSSTSTGASTSATTGTGTTSA